MEIANGILGTLKKCCSVFSAEGLNYCLIGGLAVGIVSRPRATEDIDFLMTIEEGDVERIGSLFRLNFDVVQIQDVMRLADASIWRILVREQFTAERALVIVDLVLADRDDLKQAIANRMKIELDGVIIPVASPSDLINIKKRSGRPQDLLDIEAILAENPENDQPHK
jgi:hypothetical protein